MPSTESAINLTAKALLKKQDEWTLDGAFSQLFHESVLDEVDRFHALFDKLQEERAEPDEHGGAIIRLLDDSSNMVKGYHAVCSALGVIPGVLGKWASEAGGEFASKRRPTLWAAQERLSDPNAVARIRHGLQLMAGGKGETEERIGLEKEKGRWTQKEVDEAIRALKKNKTNPTYSELLRACRNGRGKAKTAAQKAAHDYFGRNKIADNIGCAKKTVGKSPVWITIAKDFDIDLHREKKAKGAKDTATTGKIGLDMALEEASYKTCNPDPDREMAMRKIEKVRDLNRDTAAEAAQGLQDQLDKGTDPEAVCKMAELLLTDPWPDPQ